RRKSQDRAGRLRVRPVRPARRPRQGLPALRRAAGATAGRPQRGPGRVTDPAPSSTTDTAPPTPVGAQFIGPSVARRAEAQIDAGLPPLPPGWVWSTVGELASPQPNAITDG